MHRHEMHGERLRVRAGLIFGGVRINGEPLGFEHGERARARILEQIIGAPIGGGFFRRDLALVFDIPARFAQKPINDDPSVGFLRHLGHSL